MNPALPNFIFGAIYRTRTGEPDASATAAAYCCYAPAYPDTPAHAYIADCWVGDEFGRIDPGLKVSLIPVRHEDLGPIVNVIVRDSA